MNYISTKNYYFSNKSWELFMMTMIIYCKNHNPQRKSAKKLNFEKTQNKKNTRHFYFVFSS